jgi:hypothetical protein
MSFAITSVSLAGAGMAAGAVGSYWSAKNSQIQARGQADIASINAKISELGAENALQQGQRQVGEITQQAGQLKSTQRASMAANGVDLGTGSAAEVQASTDIMKTIDANTAHANAVMSAWGYRTQGVNYQNQATVASATAKAINPGMSAASSLLGNGGTVAASWYQMNKQGAFN